MGAKHVVMSALVALGAASAVSAQAPVPVKIVPPCASPDFPVWGIRPLSPDALLTANGDGTVSDAQTQRLWQQGSAPDAGTWGQAKAYCNGLELGGFSDWRVPTEAELQTLTDYTRTAPAIATAFGTTPPEWFWTAGALEGSTTYAWLVFFAQGSSYAVGMNYKNHVRCVRASGGLQETSLDGRYVADSKKGTVFDTIGGRTWQRPGAVCRDCRRCPTA